MAQPPLPVTTNTINATGGGEIDGTSQNDQIDGSNAGNVIYAGDGDDVVYGGTGNDIIYGGNGNDYLYGSEGTNVIFGGAGDDVIYAGGGNDILNGGPGDDTIYGGGGSNVAEEDELFNQATISGNTGEQTVDGPVGNDTLYQMGTIQFLDGSLSHDTGSTVAQAYRLYQAAFGRAPDAAGLGYWNSALAGGETLSAVATGYIAAPEFAARYGAPTDAQFVDQLYQNVLDRAPDSSGAAYWQNLLATGSATRGDVLAAFSESSENVSNNAAPFNAGVFAPSEAALQVLGAYQTVLGHAPDAAGLAFYTTQLDYGGLTETGLVGSLLGSAEFAAGPNGAGASNSTFANGIVRNAEGGPDASGAAYWTAQLNSGAATRTDVAVAYAGSAQVSAAVAPLVQNGYAVPA